MSLSGIMAATAPAISSAIGDAVSEFSMVDLLLDAHIVVQLVLVVLLIASFWSWAVILDKWLSLGKTRKKAAQYEDAFWSGRTDDIEGRPGGDNSNAASRVFSAASREWAVSQRTTSHPQIVVLVATAEHAMRAAIDRELGKASRGIGVLAIVGSAAPFIGLFGTVWGIMYAFINIAASQDTSLGVVAGPIAEALFATGLGLVAAIPASVFYNKFTGDVASLDDQLDTFSRDVLVRMSRRAADNVEG